MEKVIVRLIILLAWLFVPCALGTQPQENDLIAHLQAVQAHIYTHKGRMMTQGDHELLTERYFQKIDLNHTSYEALEELGILTDQQISSLFHHLASLGALISIYELQAIPSWDLGTIRLLKPFVMVANSDVATPYACHQLRFATSYRTAFQHHGPAREESPPPPYLCHLPVKLLLHYHYRQPGKHYLAFLGRKSDQDLIGIYNGTPYIGYETGCYMGESYGRIKRFIIGDYEVSLGQGLVMAPSFCMGRSVESIAIAKTYPSLIRPLSSTMRKQGFRGMAWHLKEGSYAALFYLSDRHLDVTLHRHGVQGCEHVRSVAKRGMDDTANNLDKKNTLLERVVGGACMYQSSTTQHQWGMQVLQQRYDKRIVPPPSYYSQDRFEGTHHTQASIYAQGPYRSAYLFGEIATCFAPAPHTAPSFDHTAWLAGVVMSPTKRTGISLAGRGYAPAYHASYGKALGFNSDVRNEQGIYIGWEMLYPARTRIVGYADCAYHPHPQYRIKQPSSKQELALCLTHHLAKHTLISCKTKHRRGMITPASARSCRIPKGEACRSVGYHKQCSTLRFDTRLAPNHTSPHLILQVQYSSMRQEGASLAQGVGFHLSFKKRTRKWKHSASCSLYMSDSHNTGLYFYQHSILPANHYPKLSGHGCKVQTIHTLAYHPHLKISLRAAGQWNMRRALQTKPLTFEIGFQFTYT